MKTAIVQSTLAGERFLPAAARRETSKSVRLALLCCSLLGASQPGHAQRNTPPIISVIPDQATEEDVPILAIPFTVGDTETPPDQLKFSTTFDFGAGSVTRDSIVIGGSGTNRWLSVFPPPDKFGTAQATVTVQDAGGLSASARFRVEVRPVNDPPRLSVIPAQVGLKGQGLLSVPFSVSDVEVGARINLQAWSSRQGIVSNSALRIIQGIGDVYNRRLQITLGPQSAAGSTAITIQADDSQDTNRVAFILNVVEPEFAKVSPVNSQLPAVPENFQPAWGDFNNDGLLDLVVSPFLIMTNRGSGVLGSVISLPRGPEGMRVAPADFDGDGNLDLLEFGGTLRLLRNNGGNPPTFSEVPLPGSWPLTSRAFWADIDGDGDLDILPGSINYKSDWIRNDGRNGFVRVPLSVPRDIFGEALAVADFNNDGAPDILIGPAAGFLPFLRLYHNDGAGHFQDAQITLPQATTRAAGWADVDGDGSLDLWLVQGPSSERATNTLAVLHQTPGRFTETFRLNFPTFFFGQAPTNLAWADFDHDGYVDFAGPFVVPPQLGAEPTNYTTIYHNDGTGRFTTTGLAASVERGQLLPAAADFDDDGAVDLLYLRSSPVPLRNQARVLNTLPDAPWGLHAFVAGNRATLLWNDADDGNQTAALTYNVRIGTAPGRNDVVPSMSTTNGVRMLPAPGNAGFNTWMSLELPLDQLNVETLYWSVQAVDASFQGGPFAAEQTFFINPPGNTPPSLLGIGDVSFPESTTTNITFYVRDDRTPPTGLRVLAASSNPGLVPQSGVRLSDFAATDQGLRVRLSLTPMTNQVGEAIITVTATDRGGLSTSRFFVATVMPVNPPPVPAASLTLNEVGGGQFAIELPAAWWLEVSSDLKNWSEYSAPKSATQTVTSEVFCIRVMPSAGNQFFRARRADE